LNTSPAFGPQRRRDGDVADGHAKHAAAGWQKFDEHCHSSQLWQDYDARKISAMMILILLVLFIGLALAGIYGLGTDSRDPEYSLWRPPYENQPPARHLPRRARHLG
jgi:hypothetical protein